LLTEQNRGQPSIKSKEHWKIGEIGRGNCEFSAFCADFGTPKEEEGRKAGQGDVIERIDPGRRSRRAVVRDGEQQEQQQRRRRRRRRRRRAEVDYGLQESPTHPFAHVSKPLKATK